MPQFKLSLILPCYNESQHFEESTEKIFKVLKKLKQNFEIIFVEDKSKDITRELIKNFISKYPQEHIKSIFHPKNLGRGKTVSDGIKISKGEYVGYIDIDCEISPAYISQFVQKLEEGNDVICAERKYQMRFFELIRAVASKSYSGMVRLLLNTTLVDTEAGYKFFRREKILPVLRIIEDRGWFWDTELMIRAEKYNLKIVFQPVYFYRRKDKTSTVKLIPDSIEYFKKLLQFSNKLRYEKQAQRIINSKRITNYWNYDSSMFSDQYQEFFGVPLSLVGIFLKLRYIKIVSYLKKIPGKIFLDVGCGSGIFMLSAINQGRFCIGIDYSELMLETAKKNLQFVKKSNYVLKRGRASKIPIKNNFVDIILASGLTDYLDIIEVGLFFDEIKRVLRKNGNVIITFPKKTSPLSFLRSGLGLFLRTHILHLPPIKTGYTKSDIVNLCRKANISISKWDEVLFTMWVIIGKKI